MVTPAEMEAYLLIYGGQPQSTIDNVLVQISVAADRIIALAEAIKSQRAERNI